MQYEQNLHFVWNKFQHSRFSHCTMNMLTHLLVGFYVKPHCLWSNLSCGMQCDELCFDSRNFMCYVNWAAFVQGTCGDCFFCAVVFFLLVSSFSHAHVIEVMSSIKMLYSSLVLFSQALNKACFWWDCGHGEFKVKSMSFHAQSDHATRFMFNGVCCHLVEIFHNYVQISKKKFKNGFTSPLIIILSFVFSLCFCILT